MYRRLLLIGLFLVGALVIGIGCGMAKTPITMWLSSQRLINEWAAVFERILTNRIRIFIQHRNLSSVSLRRKNSTIAAGILGCCVMART